jgi:hypothetical protein
MEKVPDMELLHDSSHRMDDSVAISRFGIGVEVIRERYHGLNMHVLSQRRRVKV